MPERAILMMAYGSPESLDDMPAYLKDIRGGRPMSAAFVGEFRGRYAQIGGKSPLNERTLEQARETEALLRARGHDVVVYVGMRHWMPWIKDAVARMHNDGVREAVSIVMAPHYSKMSIGRYWSKLEEAQEEAGSRIRFSPVDSWCRQPRLLDAQEAAIRAAMLKFDANTHGKVKLVFSAHSLPARLLDMGDPYDDELKGNARALAERLDHSDWMFSYQSAAQTGEPWLGPQIEQVVADLSEEGYENVLIAPIGFVCDHVEVLYDIDIGVQAIARKHGIRVERTESMNSSPVFVEAVADGLLEKMDGSHRTQGRPSA